MSVATSPSGTVAATSRATLSRGQTGDHRTMVENHLTPLQLLAEHLDRPLGEEVARINEDGNTIHAKFFL